MKFKSLAIWKQAFVFHFVYWKDLLPIYPILCLPLFCDGLHSLLIYNLGKYDELKVGKAFRDIWKVLPPLLNMKIIFWIKAFLWSLIPIYGIIRGTRYRIYWAMASNVIVFEGLSGENGQDRCRELAENAHDRSGTRTFVTIPALLITGCLLALVIGAELCESSYIFFICLAIIFWIVIPASGALNTFYYIKFRRFEYDNKQSRVEGEQYNSYQGN